MFFFFLYDSESSFLFFPLVFSFVSKVNVPLIGHCHSLPNDLLNLFHYFFLFISFPFFFWFLFCVWLPFSQLILKHNSLSHTLLLASALTPAVTVSWGSLYKAKVSSLSQLVSYRRELLIDSQCARWILIALWLDDMNVLFWAVYASLSSLYM